ncbi:unnamed protein product [Cuscuta europaea]|uniref:Uncharacterized protein n=1 Tax=Cuscuta europaea TaxID=41803 RepID=A0A9P1EMI0_CUSEU|nr:unnamed protein product [Cuscuta europaea]
MESQEHIFRRCAVARDLWAELRWHWSSRADSPFIEQVNGEFRWKKQEDIEVLMWGCWALWNERNLRVWEGKMYSLQQIISRARTTVDGWKQVQTRGAGGRNRLAGGTSRTF